MQTFALTLKNNKTTIQIINIKPLICWFQSNFWRKHEGATGQHYNELQKIALSCNIPSMTHKEFCMRIRQELHCNPNKRHIERCNTCKALGVPQWKW